MPVLIVNTYGLTTFPWDDIKINIGGAKRRGGSVVLRDGKQNGRMRNGAHAGASTPKKVMAIVAGMVLLGHVFFSIFFMSAEAGHARHCQAKDCPICSCVATCENTLRQTFGAAIMAVATFLTPILFSDKACHVMLFLSRNSLVKLQVRLNN